MRQKQIILLDFGHPSGRNVFGGAKTVQLGSKDDFLSTIAVRIDRKLALVLHERSGRREEENVLTPWFRCFDFCMIKLTIGNTGKFA